MPRGERVWQEAIAQGFVTENGEKRPDLTILEDINGHKNGHKNGHDQVQKPPKKPSKMKVPRFCGAEVKNRKQVA